MHVLQSDPEILIFLGGVQVVRNHHAIEPVEDIDALHLQVQRLAVGIGDHQYIPAAVVQLSEELDDKRADADHVLQLLFQGRNVHVQALRPMIQAVPLQCSLLCTECAV